MTMSFSFTWTSTLFEPCMCIPRNNKWHGFRGSVPLKLDRTVTICISCRHGQFRCYLCRNEIWESGHSSCLLGKLSAADNEWCQKERKEHLQTPLARKKCPFRVVFLSKLQSFSLLQHHGARHAELRDAVRVIDVGPLFGQVRAGPAMHLRYAMHMVSLFPIKSSVITSLVSSGDEVTQIHQWKTIKGVCHVADNFLGQGIRSRAMQRLEYLRVIMDRRKLFVTQCPLDVDPHTSAKLSCWWIFQALFACEKRTLWRNETHTWTTRHRWPSYPDPASDAKRPVYCIQSR